MHDRAPSDPSLLIVPATDMEDAAVAVVDDDPSVRRGLARLLRSVGLRVDTFASAEEYLAAPPHAGPGCVVLDVRMPGTDGLQLQRTMIADEYARPIVFLTGHGSIPMSVRTMRRGAVDFLTKPVDEDYLLDAIARALQEDRRARARFVVMQDLRERLASITPRERQVMALVVAGLLNKQVAYELEISVRTVKVHRGRVMEKMRAESVADLVRMAEQLGIRPGDSEAPGR